MAFKISFRLTMLANDKFEMVVFEEKTLETFQIVRHLNNTPLSKFISYKIYFSITTKATAGEPPSLSSAKKFYFITCFFLLPCTSFEIPNAHHYLRTHLTYANLSVCRKIF